MDQNTKTWAMILHFSVFAGYLVPMAGLIVPILIWQLKKQEMPELDNHGRMVANYLISLLIYSVVCVALILVGIGLLLLPILGVISIIFPIIGGIKANSGELWNYPGVIKIF
jgi:uncharacterized protein